MSNYKKTYKEYNWKLKWIEDLKCMHYFWDVKKKKIYIYIYISRWMLYLILSRLKWVVSHSLQPNTTRLLSVGTFFGGIGLPPTVMGWATSCENGP